VQADYLLRSVNGVPTDVIPLNMVLPFAKKYAASQIGEARAELIDETDLVLKQFIRLT
jgi:hypothetical protein